MFYLLLVIVLSGSIPLLFQLGEFTHCNRLQILCMNYLTATLTAAVMILCSGLPLFPQISGFFAAFSKNFQGSLSASGSYAAAVVLGLAMGGGYFINFLCTPIAIHACGTSISGMFNKMGALIPMVLAIFLWGEVPSAIQWVGIRPT